MLSVDKISIIIDNKIKEHTDVIEQVDQDLKQFKGLKQGASTSSMAQNAQRQMVLKDKILFHRAAILALNDLKDSING
jgi:hypothetical protein